MNEYNFIAPFYDFLQKLIFGKALQNIQKTFLFQLKDKKNILILGGGSGEILVQILAICPNADIHYQEASSNMLELTKSKLCHDQLSKIHFYHKTDFDFELKFDAVVTPFFLDLFEEKELQKNINQLESSLAIKGIWLVSDFYISGKWHSKITYRAMKLFFRIFTKLKAKELYDFDELLSQKLSRIFYKKLIWPSVFSAVYLKK